LSLSTPRLLTHASPLSLHDALPISGADILRTNSFASNIRTLCAGNAGRTTREEQLRTVYENVAASCRIARSAVEQECSRAKEERSEEHTSELQSRFDLVCRLLLDNK